MADRRPELAYEADVARGHRQVVTSAIVLGSATVAAKVAALGKDWLVARQLGAGDALDAFLVAFLLPSYAVVVLGHSFASAYVPIYLRVLEREGLPAARHLTARVLAAGTALLVFVTLGLALTAPWLLPLVGASFDGEKMLGSGRDRLVLTPEMEPGHDFKFQLHAEWQQNGQPVTEVREGHITAGQLVVVDFTKPAPKSDDAAPPAPATK